MKRKKGFTMIELMIAIVIVAILASVVAPVMRNRLIRSKWSEGMNGASTIATAIRSWAAENGENPTAPIPSDLLGLGFQAGDLNGKYFNAGAYEVIPGAGTAGDVQYTINVKSTGATTKGPQTGSLTLDHNGDFTLDQDGVVSKF